MPEQIPLDLAGPPSHASEDFLAAPGNQDALGWIGRWPSWPGFALALTGPAGCGKSHLAHIFRARTGGIVVPASRLDREGVPVLAEHPAVAVEDADRGVDEAALFHLHNLLRETGRFLLLTGRQPPARWRVALPDLRSRLAAMPIAAILPPDDGLLESVILKLFSDRQIRVGPDVVAYMLSRMERSFHAARALVHALDAAALAAQRPITIPLVREVMSQG